MNGKKVTSGIKRPAIYRLIGAQAGATLIISLGFLLKDQVAAYSALLGGFIFVLPNIYFAEKAFAHTGARAARQIVNSFYKGEAVKIALTAVLFTVVFVLVKPLNVLALFVTFIIVLTTNWLAPLLLSHQPLRK
jgi:ATP synthase protein I